MTNEKNTTMPTVEVEFDYHVRKDTGKAKLIALSSLLLAESLNGGAMNRTIESRANEVTSIVKDGFLESQMVITGKLNPEHIEHCYLAAIAWLNSLTDDEIEFNSAKTGYKVTINGKAFKAWLRKIWAKQPSQADLVIAGHGRTIGYLVNAFLAFQAGESVTKMPVSSREFKSENWQDWLSQAHALARLENRLPDKQAVDKTAHLRDYLKYRDFCKENGLQFVSSHTYENKEQKKLIAKGQSTFIAPNGKELQFFEPFLLKGQEQLCKSIVDVHDRLMPDFDLCGMFFTGKLSINKYKRAEIQALLDADCSNDELRSLVCAMCSPFATDTREKVATPASKIAAMKSATGVLVSIENEKDVADVTAIIKQYTEARLATLQLLENKDSDLNANRELLLELISRM